MGMSRSRRVGRRLLIGPLAAVVLVGVLVASTVELGSTDSDSDEDGLLDIHEIFGWTDDEGRVWKTDPKSADTDGDGLADGFEAGPQVVGAGGETAYDLWSNPSAVDSDEDGLHDGPELILGTSPTEADTDDDTLADGLEVEADFDPTNSNADGDDHDDREEHELGSDPFLYDLTRTGAAGALLGGLVAGEWEWGARRAGLSDEQLSSTQYLVGRLVVNALGRSVAIKAVDKLAAGDYLAAGAIAATLIPQSRVSARVLEVLKTFVVQGPQAMRAARLVIDRLDLSGGADGAIRSLVSVDADGSLVALAGGPSDTEVYVGRDARGDAAFCGVTDDLPHQRSEVAHGFRLFSFASDVTRAEGRAVAQACSEHLRGDGVKTALTAFDPTDRNADYFADAVAFGEEQLKSALSAGTFDRTS